MTCHYFEVTVSLIQWLWTRYICSAYQYFVLNTCITVPIMIIIALYNDIKKQGTEKNVLFLFHNQECSVLFSFWWHLPLLYGETFHKSAVKWHMQIWTMALFYFTPYSSLWQNKEECTIIYQGQSDKSMFHNLC